MAENVVAICDILLQRARDKYHRYTIAASKVKERDHVQLQESANKVLQFVEEIAIGNLEVTVVETLDNDDAEMEMEYDEEEETNKASTAAEETSQEWQSSEIEKKTYTLEQMSTVVNFYDGAKKNKLQRTQTRYRFVTGHKMISSFRKYVNNNGRKEDKFRELEKYVISRFRESRDSLACVSEHDLRRWGIRKATDLKLRGFKASRKWLFLLKKKGRIVSRKITKLLTRKELVDQETHRINADQFLLDTLSELKGVTSGLIWNFDQSGFNYEHANLRTLSNKGEKDTEALVKSKNAVSHSYSIMPLVSMSGRLASKLLICLQEAGGTIGPRVLSKLEIPDNIYLTASKSGKLDKGIMKNWLSNYVDNMGKSGIELIHDSWTGQTDNELYSGLKNVNNHYKIPPHTTQWIQPLDTYFFREYKIIRRKIFDRVLLDGLDVSLQTRDNVIKMHSLIYNQFQSDRFIPMIQYAWFKCGYTDNRAGHFENVNELLFEVDDKECDVEDCDEDCFIRCSHCRDYLCIHHFFVEFHYHTV